jgi:hypothetical protein
MRLFAPVDGNLRGVQIGVAGEGPCPVGAEIVSAAQRSLHREAQPDDMIRRHLGVLGVKRQHALEIAAVPDGDPFAAEFPKLRGRWSPLKPSKSI